MVTAKSAAAATEISTIEWKYQIAQRNKIGASNRINPLLGVIKTTQCEEVTGMSGDSRSIVRGGFQSSTLKTVGNRHVSAAALSVSTASQLRRLTR